MSAYRFAAVWVHRRRISVILLLMAAVLSIQHEGALGIRSPGRRGTISTGRQLLYAESPGRHSRILVHMSGESLRGSAAHGGFDLNYYTNKRRVPNGPDPIHNRRAGKSREPPAA